MIVIASHENKHEKMAPRGAIFVSAWLSRSGDDA